MASRIVEAGSVVARTQYLLLTRVLKEKPLWLDVTEAFPPVEPLPPPHKARHLHYGRAKALSYPQDSLKRDFPKFYTVVTKAGLKPTEEVFSLDEAGKHNSHNLVDQFVREQSKGISLGMSRKDAGDVALEAVKNLHPTLTVQTRNKEAKTGPPDATTPLEHVVIDVIQTLK